LVGEAGWAQGGGHALVVVAEPGFGQGTLMGGLGAVEEEVATAARSTGATVVVDVSGTGGASGAAGAVSAAGGAAESGRARAAAGRLSALPLDCMDTESTLRGPGSACDTATAVTTMATLVSATISARGVSRRIDRRNTVITSPASRRRRGRPHAPGPSRRLCL
jgi:hypothetical protein